MSPEPTIGRITAELPKKRSSKDRFDEIQFSLGVYLRALPGILPDMLNSTKDQAVLLARRIAQGKSQLDDLDAQQEALKNEFKDIAQTHYGFRGIKSEQDNAVVTVSPNNKVTWNLDLLRAALGSTYSSIVREKLVMEVSVPPGHIAKKRPLDDERLRRELTKTLMGLDFTADDLEKIVTMRTVPTVDEAKIDELLQLGKLSLPDGTKQVDQTLSVRVDWIKKPAES